MLIFRVLVENESCSSVTCNFWSKSSITIVVDIVRIKLVELYVRDSKYFTELGIIDCSEREVVVFSTFFGCKNSFSWILFNVEWRIVLSDLFCSSVNLYWTRIFWMFVAKLFFSNESEIGFSCIVLYTIVSSLLQFFCFSSLDFNIRIVCLITVRRFSIFCWERFVSVVNCKESSYNFIFVRLMFFITLWLLFHTSDFNVRWMWFFVWFVKRYRHSRLFFMFWFFVKRYRHSHFNGSGTFHGYLL